MTGYDLDSPRMQTSSDEEYKQPSEEDNSADDEEATEFRNYAKID